MSKYRNTQHPHVGISATFKYSALFLYIRFEKHSTRQYYEENEERKTIRNPHILVV